MTRAPDELGFMGQRAIVEYRIGNRWLVALGDVRESARSLEAAIRTRFADVAEVRVRVASCSRCGRAFEPPKPDVERCTACRRRPRRSRTAGSAPAAPNGASSGNRSRNATRDDAAGEHDGGGPTCR